MYFPLNYYAIRVRIGLHQKLKEVDHQVTIGRQRWLVDFETAPVHHLSLWHSWGTDLGVRRSRSYLTTWVHIEACRCKTLLNKNLPTCCADWSISACCLTFPVDILWLLQPAVSKRCHFVQKDIPSLTILPVANCKSAQYQHGKLSWSANSRKPLSPM